MSFTALRCQQYCKHLFHGLMVLLLALPFPALLLGLAPYATAQTGQKVVQGKVVGSSNQPQTGAIVYLKNTKTGDIKSFISTADGSYRFGQLSPDVDYEIWADYNGRKSNTKTVSSFDSKKLLDYQLKVDTAK
jgi:Carboxypeptidase regulatory-like domain